jgi:hypothetical protein
VSNLSTDCNGQNEDFRACLEYAVALAGEEVVLTEA